ncbi:MAG: MarR family transcriptional regulator [Proteobacteria bacterium]|nr:MAG: MarR family transcriptional regulator [Pseudomonadota bacterium]
MKIAKFLSLNMTAVIVMSGQEIERTFRKELASFKLSFIDGLVLTAVYFEEGHLSSPSELTKTFRQSKSNMSHIISRLQTQKLITRKSSPEDLRSLRVTLTTNGERVALKLIKIFDRLQSRIEDNNGGEDGVRRLNEKIRRATKLLSD